MHAEPPIITGKMARPLNPDIHPWLRQDEETSEAYKAFEAYRDADTRRVTKPDMTEVEKSRYKRWSAQWSWSARARAWDRYVARQDLDDMVRYRRTMNERHRTIARTALSKAAQWLVNLNPDTMRPSDAARLLEVAVRMEREAAGAHLGDEGMLPEQEEETTGEQTLGGLFNVDPETEAALAAAVNAALQRRDG